MITKNHIRILLLIIMLTVSIKSDGDFALCPVECDCKMRGNSFRVSCTNRNLTQIPAGWETLDINWFDLSGNAFTEIPHELSQLKSLEKLILDNNQISNLPANALEGFDSLQILQLNKNNITNWASIHPKELLTYAPNIKELYLNENYFTTISDIDETLILTSPSLQSLHLSKCKILKLIGNNFLSGLPKLSNLILENNPIQQLPEIVSGSLTTLDLSNTILGQLLPRVFENLPELTAVDLSRNHRISLVTKSGAVTSSSIQEINLSYCNMNEIELNGFEELITVRLKKNMIHKLDKESFLVNSKLVNIDLSYNAISVVAVDTFRHLKSLKYIDLSYNMIIRVERDTFKYNDMLTSINLSQNYISRFNKFHAKSLLSLNMSGCEIINIDPNAFQGFPGISELDLSHNLISIFPEMLSSDSLQQLDLRMCR